MALPLSRTQIEKLGKRLVAADKPSAEDVELLNELLVAYRAVLTEAVARVESAVALPAASRVKTRGTTIDKLRRHGGSWLSSIQDLAGMRIVAAVDRSGQDELVRTITGLFADETRAPRVVDRRETPSSMRARFKAEIEFDDRPEVEVAALDASSEEELRRTHGRYFLTLAELADRLG